MFFVLSKVLGFFAIPSNLVISIGLAGPAAAGDALCGAPGDGSQSASLVAAGDPRPFAGRQCADHPAGAAVSAVGCRARGARRHHRARRGDLARRFGGPQRGGAQRGGRAHDRRCRAGAALSRCPHSVLRRQPARCSSARAARPSSRCACSRVSALPRARVLLEDRSRNTVENAVFSKAIAQPKAGRALAAGDVGLSFAAGDRRLPQGRAFRSSPIRSIGARAGRGTYWRPFRDRGRGASAHRYGGARMGRPTGLLAHRQDLGTLSRCQFDRA